MDLSRRRGRGKARGSSTQDENSSQQPQSSTNTPRPQILQPHPITRFQQPQQGNRPSVPRQPVPPGVNIPHGQTQIRPASKQRPGKQSVDSSKVIKNTF